MIGGSTAARPAGRRIPKLAGRCIEVIGFDLDNTLYDEDQYFAAAFAAIGPLLAVRCDAAAADIVARLWATLRARGRHYHLLFDDVLAELGLTADCLPDVLATFRAVATPLRPFPGVPELLGDLRRDYRLGLVTSGMRPVQESKLRLLGLADAFEHVVFSSTLAENKPGQLPFRSLLEALGASPDRAVYVGDNPRFDFRGANELGMVTIRVRNPEFDGAEVAPGSDGHVRVAQVTELRELFL